MKILKRLLVLLVSFVIIYFIAFFSLQYYIGGKLKEIPNLSYKDLSLGYNLDLKLEELFFQNQELELEVTEVKIKVDLKKALFSDTLLLNNIDLNAAVVTLRNDTTVEVYQQKEQKQFVFNQIDLSHFDFYEVKGKDTITTIQNAQATVTNLSDTTYSVKNIQNMSVDHFERQIDELNFISFAQLNVQQGGVYVDTFRIKNQYTKKDYINYIDFEKDHIDFMVNGIELNNFDFIASRKKLERITIDSVTIDTTCLQVYRDKTIKDDERIKSTYGQMLQQLGFELDINVLDIANSKLFYSSKRENYKMGEFMFDRLRVQAKHINNIPSKEQNILVNGHFGINPESDVRVDISYNPYANIETFQLSFLGKNIETSYLNSMLMPVINLKLNGVVQELKGQMITQGMARGDFSFKSKDINLELFKEDKKRKLFSFVANKFLGKPIKKQTKLEEVKKDPTKSMWNFSWNFIIQGLKESLL